VQLRTLIPLATCLLCACAGAGRRAAPNGPVAWPPGSYVATAQLQYTAGSVRPGSSARRAVQAELAVGTDGSMTLTSGDGSCQEVATRRADQRDFRCGDTVFRFVIDGETIRGDATAPVTYWVSAWSRCTRWDTDASGRQQCVRMEEHPEEERTARATARLAVVAAG
jgi:hypothetical protein